MSRDALLRALLIAAASGASGCLFSEPCDCPNPVPARVVGDRWTSRDRGVDAYLGPDATPFPHGREPKSLVLDRDAGVVTITRSVDGSTLVERWRIRSADLR